MCEKKDLNGINLFYISLASFGLGFRASAAGIKTGDLLELGA